MLLFAERANLRSVWMQRGAARVSEHDLTLGAEFREGRQHGAKDFPNGGEIVAGDPVGEFDEFGSESGQKIEQFSDFADFCGFGSVRNAFHDYADQ